MSDIVLNSTIEFIENEISDSEEAFASFSLNPNFRWGKVIVTDDRPNGNNQKVPLEEFDNLIKTGVNSPVKMAKGKISDGHAEAMGNPIGTISHLTKSGNKVIALAALWEKERPEDIALLKEMYDKKEYPNVSWELSYTESSKVDDVEELHGVSLNGLTVVGLPAYQGRTIFYSMASEEKSEEITKMEELDELKQKITDLEASLKEREDEISALKTEKESIASEVETLKQFKSVVENKAQELEKLASLQAKFKEAGLDKDQDYFDKNKETLLGLSETALDFMVQEMVSFASKVKETQSSKENDSVPNLINTDPTVDDIKAMANALRELNK
jgi:hypothetical protein